MGNRTRLRGFCCPNRYDCFSGEAPSPFGDHTSVKDRCFLLHVSLQDFLKASQLFRLYIACTNCLKVLDDFFGRCFCHQ